MHLPAVPSGLVLLLVAVSAGLVSGCGSIQLDRALVPMAPSPAPAPPLVERWEREVDAAFGPAAALVGARRIAVGTRSGHVVVLDLDTGSRVGSVSMGQSVEAALVASPDGRTLYVPVARGRASVVAHRVQEGRELWSWRPDGDREAVDAGLALAGGTLVAAAHDGTVIGLDAETGAVRWQHAGAAGVQNHAAPVVLPAGGVAVADDAGAVRAFDAATGGIRWTASVGAPVYATPAVAGNLLLVPTTRGRLVALDAATGQTRWSRTLGSTDRARLTTPSVSGSRAAIGSTDGTVTLIDAATGETVWTWTGTGAVVGGPALSGPFVYVGTMDRRLVALDAATGEERWNQEVRGRIKSAPTIADGRLIVLTEPRHVVVFEPAAVPAVAPSSAAAARP